MLSSASNLTHYVWTLILKVQIVMNKPTSQMKNT